MLHVPGNDLHRISCLEEIGQFSYVVSAVILSAVPGGAIGATAGCPTALPSLHAAQWRSARRHVYLRAVWPRSSRAIAFEQIHRKTVILNVTEIVGEIGNSDSDAFPSQMLIVRIIDLIASFPRPFQNRCRFLVSSPTNTHGNNGRELRVASYGIAGLTWCAGHPFFVCSLIRIRVLMRSQRDSYRWVDGAVPPPDPDRFHLLQGSGTPDPYLG